MNPDTPSSPPATADDQSPPRFPFSILFLVWLAVVLVGTLITLILPETFVSRSRIKVQGDKSDIEELGGKVGLAQYDPYYIATEFEVIQSELILGMVVSNLNLNIEWGKKYNEGQALRTQETLTLLRGRINLRPVRNTMLIDINAYSDNPVEAAKIANSIAESYRQYRLNQGRAVIIIETAMPGLKPVRPNKPLNIILSIFVGGFVGLLLAVLVYLLDRRAFQSKSGIGSTANPRTARTLLRTAIALVVGVVVGYNCAEPLETTSMFVTLLIVVLGGFAFVYIELAKPTFPFPSTGDPPPRQW